MVILDMTMPKMGGGEVYDRIKEINPDVKVLLSSGYSLEGQASEIIERGCNGFVCVSERRDGDAAKRIEIAFTVGIPDPRAFAARQGQGQSAVGRHQ